MKKIYSLFLLIFTLSFAQAQKNPISYRFGLEAGGIGDGFSVIISPLQLQLNPSLQIGVLGIGIQNFGFSESEEYYINSNVSDHAETALQIATVKYDFLKLSFAKNFVPYIKASTFLQSSYTELCLTGDIKIGLSLYSKYRGSNLGVYLGALYGAYGVTNNELFNMPIFFKFGLQFEFGGKGAWGFKKMKKERSGNGWNNFLSILGIVGEGLAVAGESLGGTTSTQYNNGNISQSQTSSSKSSSGKSQSDYQREYNRWENLAKKSYNQLTSQSISPGLYTVKIGLLRDQQREMRNIRKEADRKGFSITASIWEDKNP